MCVQRFDDSRNSAIHTTYRISLRSSSLREPRYPLLRVVQVRMQRPGRVHIEFLGKFVWCCWVNKWANPTGHTREHAPADPQNELEAGGTAARACGPQPNPGHAAEATQPAPTGRLRNQPTDRTIEVHGVCIDRFNDPSAGSPRLLRTAG
jgi:hypothetical protein